MNNSTSVSLVQLILSCIGTVVTILVIVVGSYISLRVEAAANEARLESVEKRVEKADSRTDEKFDRIMQKLTELEVNMEKRRQQ